MIIHSHIKPLQDFLETQRNNGRKIGFVPTMGALHEGHLKLMKASLEATDITVCSIFVNPTQFNDPKDFEKYPNRLAADIELLYSTGVQVIFVPAVPEIYPPGEASRTYNLVGLDNRLEGSFRPGHFQGVCQVMDRLLHIVEPDQLFMGQKDFQQCLVIQKLLKITRLKTKLVIFPTIRENTGLAMSSRNMRLTTEQRDQAKLIYKTLNFIKENIRAGSVADLKQKSVQTLTENGFRVDYIEIADRENLTPVENWDGNQKLVMLAAAFLGEVRLIDNLLSD